MKAARIVVVTAFTLGALACTSMRPVKINAGEQCFRCRRTISDTRLAAERITGFVEKYRAPGCMASYVVSNPVENAPIFVTDYRTGEIVDANTAFFVRVILDDITGERDYRAYTLRADAVSAAEELHTVPIDWNTVLELARVP
jgi:hypothetical protein